MKELDLGLSKGLLDSVSGVLKDSSKVKAEIAKTANEQLSSHYTKMAARPLSTEEAKVNTYASKAPERRVNDAISAVYAKSVAESNARAKSEAEAIQRAYAARGAAKPITEEKTVKCDKTDIVVDPTHPETLKSRKAKAQADVSDETILSGDVIDEKAHTIPKTEKEKQLAALAEPKDKITHADVMVGRGVRKEGFAEMDAWLKKRKEEQGTGKFEKKKISTGTVYTKKSEKEQEKVDEAMQKSDVPAYLRKQKGEKPLTVADVKGPRKDSISSKEGLAKLRNEEVDQLDELKASTLASYINKAKHSVASAAYAFGAGADTPKNANKFANRLVGINKATKGLVKKIKEETDTPGNSTHQCAIHVKHAKLGEGKTLFSQHAEPDAEGNIAWYDVMFAEGIEKKVPTTDLEILVSESHMNHKKGKK